MQGGAGRRKRDQLHSAVETGVKCPSPRLESGRVFLSGGARADTNSKGWTSWKEDLLWPDLLSRD